MSDAPTGEQCFICGDDHRNRLQTHHVVPRRHGGTDNPENLVTLCASCHQAIEQVYDDRFYKRLRSRSADAPADDLEADGCEIDEEESPDRRLDPNNKHIVALTEENERIGEWGGFDKVAEIHCGYCPTKFKPHQHARIARHLRVEHGIDDPYKLNEVRLAELYPESRQRAQESKSRLGLER